MSCILICFSGKRTDFLNGFSSGFSEENSDLYPLINMRGRSIWLIFLTMIWKAWTLHQQVSTLCKNPDFSKDLPFVFKVKNAVNPAENEKHKVSQSSANFRKVKSGLFAVQSRVF